MVGTSAGGVQALQKLVSGLPSDFPAAVFAVMHIPAWRQSELPEILGRNGALQTSHARHNQVIEPGHLYLAPPDYHLLIEPDHRMTLWHGPKENNFRPAINPLFRSAADVYKERVMGVILSGSLDEGIAGLAWIKRHGGIAIVQDPEEAAFPSMPQNALMHVPVDYTLRNAEISKLLVQLANGRQGRMKS